MLSPTTLESTLHIMILLFKLGAPFTSQTSLSITTSPPCLQITGLLFTSQIPPHIRDLPFTSQSSFTPQVSPLHHSLPSYHSPPFTSQIPLHITPPPIPLKIKALFTSVSSAPFQVTASWQRAGVGLVLNG